MSLADDLRKEPAPVRTGCAVGVLLAGLSPDDKRELEQAVDKIRSVPSDIRKGRIYPYTSAWLLGVLRANGLTLSKESLRKHLTRECTCESV